MSSLMFQHHGVSLEEEEQEEIWSKDNPSESWSRGIPVEQDFMARSYLWRSEPEVEKDSECAVARRFNDALDGYVRQKAHLSKFNPHTVHVIPWATSTKQQKAASRSYFEHVRLSIKETYKLDAPGLAIQNICQIWSELDETMRLAQARVSILLKRVDHSFHPVPSAEKPKWLGQLIGPVRDVNDGNPIHPSLIATLEKLLIQVSLRLPLLDEEMVSLEKGHNGRLVMEMFIGNKMIRWILSPTDLSWPGVNALVSKRIGIGPEALRTSESLHTAMDVLAHLNETLETE